MDFIKTFEEFIADQYGSEPVQEETTMNVDSTDSIVPESAKRKLWEFVHECMESAVDYDDDEDDNHTLESYMAEAAMLMASYAMKSLKENRALIALAAKAAGETNEEDAHALKEKTQAFVKNRLDEICNHLYDGFSKGVDIARENNAGISALVASEMMKEE